MRLEKEGRRVNQKLKGDKTGIPDSWVIYWLGDAGTAVLPLGRHTSTCPILLQRYPSIRDSQYMTQPSGISILSPLLFMHVGDLYSHSFISTEMHALDVYVHTLVCSSLTVQGTSLMLGYLCNNIGLVQSLRKVSRN